jgi:hypothetical protein
MVRFFASILFFILSCNLLGQFKVEVKTDTTDYLIGDFIQLIIKAEFSKEYSLQEPSFRDSLKKFEIIKEETAKYDTNQSNITYQKNITLAYYDSAEVYIPAFTFVLTQQGDTSKKYFSSDSIAIRVHSLEVKADEEIKDIKQPIKIPLNIWEILLWALIIIVAVALIFFIVKRVLSKKKVVQEKPDIILPPHVVALMKLEELEKERLWQAGKVKEYHSRITEIIREYFEKRFSFPALELTSSEQIQYLEKIPEAQNIIKTTEEFFTNADLVKFAKFNPVPDLNQIMMSQAKDIVSSTIPVVDNLVEKNEVTNVQ